MTERELRRTAVIIPPKGRAVLCVWAAVPGLLAALDQALAHRVRPVKMVLPYDKLGLAEAIRTRGRVNVEEYRDEGVYMEGFVKADDVYLYQPYLV